MVPYRDALQAAHERLTEFSSPRQERPARRRIGLVLVAIATVLLVAAGARAAWVVLAKPDVRISGTPAPDGWSVRLHLPPQARDVAYGLPGDAELLPLGTVPSMLDPGTHEPMAQTWMTIPYDRIEGPTEIRVRFVDAWGIGRGPIALRFDPEAESVASAKYVVGSMGPWVTIDTNSCGDVTNTTLAFAKLVAQKHALRAIAWSVDSDALDRSVRFRMSRRPSISVDDELVVKLPKRPRFVAVKLTWKDGAESETRHFSPRGGPDGVSTEPFFGKTVASKVPPPPLSGGTLLVTADGSRAVAADPDRDRVYVVTLADKTVKTIALRAGDEPGRIAEDAAGRVHVALRRGGAVATLDVARGVLLARRETCPAPRGIAFDAPAGRLVVACEGGEVVALDAAPEHGNEHLVARLDRDLRDVVVSGSRLFVSRFREAEVLELDPAGTLVARRKPFARRSTEPTLAWRMRESGENREPMLLHEVSTTRTISTKAGGYGEPPADSLDACPTASSLVDAAFTDGAAAPLALPRQIVLPVDFVADGKRLAVVAAGNAHAAGLPQVWVLERARGAFPCATSTMRYAPPGEITAIAFAKDGGIVVQSREPAALVLEPGDVTIALSDESRADTGHAIFHANSGSGIACASCHGEGGDDAHVWRFSSGARRTPSLRGTLDGLTAFHWGGEFTDVAMLVDDVFTKRMNGPVLATAQKGALRSWLYAIPSPAPASGVDVESAARGKALFESPKAACSACHDGPRFTSSALADVGTHGTFRVPSLVGVSARAPFLHDGCAPTLEARFGRCGGSRHGGSAKLSRADVTNLVAYLDTL